MTQPQAAELSDPVQSLVRLPDGTEIVENGPVVIVGPNGSGKSRRSRELTSTVPIDLVSALRVTRISQQLSPVALGQAKQQYRSQREQARTNPYELANDFDYMLTALIGETLQPALSYLARSRAGDAPAMPPVTSLEKMQKLWAKIFPGRQIEFRDYMPFVINSVAVGDEPAEYTAWQMSDGEKAALYLAGRAFTADPSAVLLIDEPETHFHSLLAVEFWNAIEAARPDVRFVYVTHDMTFAASREAAAYLLANPIHGLTPISLATDAGEHLAAVLLGTASLSFFASRVVFCEGESDALDVQLYDAWFNEKETIVQPVGSCDMVIRSVSALKASKLIQNLDVRGVVDRDFHADDYLSALPAGVHPLKLHEVETLLSLPDVVKAVAQHVSADFNIDTYRQQLVEKYSDGDRHRTILERWKTRVDRKLGVIVATVSSKTETVDTIAATLPDIFDQKQWSFSPQTMLDEEKAVIEGAFKSNPQEIDDVLRLMPGKQTRGLAPGAVGMKPAAYDRLIFNALKDDDPTLKELTTNLRLALQPFMPEFV